MAKKKKSAWEQIIPGAKNAKPLTRDQRREFYFSSSLAGNFEDAHPNVLLHELVGKICDELAHLSAVIEAATARPRPAAAKKTAPRRRGHVRQLKT